MKNNIVLTSKFIFLINLLLICNCCVYRYAPSKINVTDKEGLKQGVWVEINHEGDEDRIFFSHYKNNFLHGQFREFYMDGTLRGKGKNNNGNRIGRWEYYLKDGNLILWKTYDKDGNELESGRVNPVW